MTTLNGWSEESRAGNQYTKKQNSHTVLRHRIFRLETLLARAFYVLEEVRGTSELVQDIEHEVLNCSRRGENHYWGRGAGRKF